MTIEPRELTAEEREYYTTRWLDALSLRIDMAEDLEQSLQLDVQNMERLLAALLHAEAQRDDLEQRLADCAAQLDAVIGERDKAIENARSAVNIYREQTEEALARITALESENERLRLDLRAAETTDPRQGNRGWMAHP